MKEIRAGLFMHYLYGGEKYLAKVISVFNNYATILLFDVEKVKNKVVPEFMLYSRVEEVDIRELVPIKGLV